MNTRKPNAYWHWKAEPRHSELVEESPGEADSRHAFGVVLPKADEA